MAVGDEVETGVKADRPRLFLSYTRADIDRARPIIAILEDAGFDVWWDQMIEGGDHYLPTTEAALEGADCVVVLWSKLSVDSNWVRDEAQSGRERGRLVPVTLDGTMAPLGFRQIQLIDISGWNGKPDAPEIGRVITAIHRLIDPAKAPASKPASLSPATTGGGGVSRRNLMLGGAGLALVAGGFGAWQMGVFDGTPASDAVMSMAVLPFANLTGDEEQAWFSDGLSNELRQALSRNPRLRVSAPASSRRNENEDDFEIARALGVGAILRGSVQRAAETVRIFVELIEVEGAVVRWSESYDRSFDDVLAVQTEIADTVALSLVLQIAGQENAQQSLEDQRDVGGTENVAAYEAYLRGSELASLSAGPESDAAALAYFDAAIEADPNYAAAHAKRAAMFAATASSSSEADQVSVLFDQSVAAARRAIELAPDLALGHRILGFALYYGQLDRAAAIPHYDRAVQAAPGDATTLSAVALFYAYGDQQQRAMQLMEQVLQLDPLNPQSFRQASAVAYLARDYAKAEVHAEKAIEMNPNIASANYFLGAARLMRRDIEGAIAAFEAEPVPVFSLVGLAIAHDANGDRDQAVASYTAMLDTCGDACLYQQSQVFAQWGDSEEAIERLSRAFETRDPGVLFAPNDGLLDPLRSDPEFDRLLLTLTP